MGWINEAHPGHEGYMLGLRVSTESGLLMLRELKYGDREGPIDAVQVGCDCGWRSPVFHARLRARWVPWTVVGLEDWEDEAVALWREHLRCMHETEHLKRRKDGWI